MQGIFSWETIEHQKSLDTGSFLTLKKIIILEKQPFFKSYRNVFVVEAKNIFF